MALGILSEGQGEPLNRAPDCGRGTGRRGRNIGSGVLLTSWSCMEVREPWMTLLRSLEAVLAVWLRWAVKRRQPLD